ncbi:MAG: hypothetical protein AB7R89_05185 [Dehalococcoidia bacterium]
MSHRHFIIPAEPTRQQRRLPLVPIALLLALLTLVALGGTRVTAHQSHTNGATEEAKERRVAFHDTMRRLWEDHIVWTRMYLVSAIAELPDTQATAERLLRNQTDIGDAIRPYYGDAAGDQLTALLRDHILIAVDLVAAAKAGDTARLAGEQSRWEANADAIGAFLNDTNPRHWPRDEMAAMMRTHLEVTAAEALARLRGDWAADIAAYDAVHEQILRMADMLSSGIIEQFPEHFR